MFMEYYNTVQHATSRPLYFKTCPPRPKSLAPTIFQNTPSSPEIAPAHYLGRSKVTLLSLTLSTQTQAEKPIGKGRTVTPLTFQTNASVRHGSTPLPISTARPHSYLVGAKSPSPRESPFSRVAKPQPHLHGAPHRTNFTAALLPNAGDAVHLSSCTGPRASYSVLLVLP